MAKSGSMKLLNRVLKNCGLTPVTSLSGLDTAEQICWDAINESIQDIFSDSRFQQLEQNFSLTMSSATRSYAKPATMADFNKYTFGNQVSDASMEFITPEEFFAEHPDQAEEGKGQPNSITYFKEKFYTTPKPNADCHGSAIYFKGWKVPKIFTETASDTGTASTTDVPEEFENTLLVNLATYKAMHYLGMAEASIYHQKVFGIPGDPDYEGSLAKFKRKYRSSDIKPRVTYVF